MIVNSTDECDNALSFADMTSRVVCVDVAYIYLTYADSDLVSKSISQSAVT